MTRFPTAHLIRPFRGRLRHLAAALLTSTLLACGGGGGGDAPTSGAQAKSFSGVVTQYDGAGLLVDGVAVDTSGLANLPAELRVGIAVEVEGVMDNGVIYAQRIKLDDDSSDDVPKGVRNELEGRITAMSSPAIFSVNGVPVDATGASVLPSGLAVGSLVEVYGILVNGVMQAVKVELEDDDDDDHDDDSHDDDGHDDDNDDDDDDSDKSR